MKTHFYKTQIKWIGNCGTGTSDYKSYSRDHEILADGKTDFIPASSDPSFRGDPSRYNPEELFLASLSSCHMLWYLHLCAVNGIAVLDYSDSAEGTMQENSDGSGQFSAVTLQPKVRISDLTLIKKALALHHEANQKCFIANSCNFPVSHQPEVTA
ncbi:OsmC family protein [Marinilongibacter aquaticus]|uniref:OsmC family protein n=1 Tax=Marinilongibacter aquaticus TaxID=2975157 RepID=UPI0021BD724F|nr:OsmC family protein [Marinilongibacter aquaticus]UBM59706.1 OsmC family protein [Marinilongibacter aquaticus]